MFGFGKKTTKGLVGNLAGIRTYRPGKPLFNRSKDPDKLVGITPPTSIFDSSVEEISIGKYHNLPKKEKGLWKPLYGRYRTIKEKDYCMECGHFTGYNNRKVPIGKPVKYQKKDIFDLLNDDFMDSMAKAATEGLKSLKMYKGRK